MYLLEKYLWKFFFKPTEDCNFAIVINMIYQL